MISFHLPHQLTFNYEKNDFGQCTKTDAIRYLKGLYSNKTRFEQDFLRNFKYQELAKPMMNFLLDAWDDATPFTYKEAFALDDQNFQRMVFASVDIAEMMEHLGKERIATDGKHVVRKTFDRDGNYTGDKEYDNVYETYSVNGSELGLRQSIYAVRCWCTSTNKEHWLWIDEAYRNDPLAAIASTFHMHENVIPHITELKRQGDIMLVELDQEVTPEGNSRPLTADEYFGLLTSET